MEDLQTNSEHRQIASVHVKNDPDVITSTPDKETLSFSIFASNLMLDNMGNLLHDFPMFTEHNLSSIFITARNVSRLIKILTLGKR